ncbi:MAG: DNA-formamidopyrimidine glycosylase, partial [Dehalococcoidia bacterium]|nr:DNA-formamidopyrimidine glycosylase [Dehalococcoidia bacterium]
MPELPEVETIARQLAESVVDKTITAVQLFSDRLFVVGEAETLTGATVRRARRYAKFLVLDLADGRSLIVHLNLAGQVRVDL